jgi:L-aspartate oxidase
MSADVQREDRPVIIGGGIAGLLTALHLAPTPVLLLSRTALGTEASSAWAQGGLAAAVGDDDDTGRHLADTLAAGDGLCDRAASSRILEEAPAAIEALEKFGVRFDRDPQGRFRLGLEAAHSRRRIIHVDGDGTGREIMRALVAAVRNTPSITVAEGLAAHWLAVADNNVQGICAGGIGKRVFFKTRRVVLASGGVGGLFSASTNPLGSSGQGLALAAHAGAVLTDMEFIQFHPTALGGSGSPMTLISEAVRGDGAALIDEAGHRFLAGTQGAELAPRDVVARAVWNHLTAGHRVFLDARAQGAAFAKRFPAIADACGRFGIDPGRDLVPVRPAQHYHMGGVRVDGAGRTSVNGMWACGEVASTGLHGANRLASNSLTEAVVCSRWVAKDLLDQPLIAAQAVPIDHDVPFVDAAPVRTAISRALGVVRDRKGLTAAIRTLLPFAEREGPASDPATVGLMMAVAALRRRESRGAHFRTDYPHHDALAERSNITLHEALREAREPTFPSELESLPA